MGSVVQEAARGMIHQLGGIQVLRLASVLYLFATAVATAVARPIRPSIAAASGRARAGCRKTMRKRWLRPRTATCGSVPTADCGRRMRGKALLEDNEAMTGIQFVTDERS